jgi:hypothetical protein
MVCMDTIGDLTNQKEVTGFLFSNSTKAKEVRPDTGRAFSKLRTHHP